MTNKNLERFLKYVSFSTNSNPNSGLHPSSDKQWALLKHLEKEMKDMGLSDVYLSDKGYVYGHLKKNSEGYKTIGFIAHVDTSCDASDENINPQIINNYDGNDIILNKELNIITKVSEYPFLKELKGRTIITTDGLTLLGADDKAGICTIMGAIDYLNEHPEIKHGNICVCFTPDEEIGEGTMFFEKDKFPCDFAYTIDGGLEGEINYENFNAASAKVTIHGSNIHPGTAKGHMINSILLSQEFNSHLDPNMVPEKTEKYEGFNHLNSISGNVEETKMHYIIRNHDMNKFNAQKNEFKRITELLNKKYNANIFELELNDSYYNMYEIIKDHMEIVSIAKDATIEANVKPDIRPIRGGTDGAMLTYKGIMTPNLGTGGFNFHGKYEGVSLEGMEKVIQIIINIIKKVKA